MPWPQHLRLSSGNFDVEYCIEEYRRAIGLRDASKTDAGRARHETRAELLRAAWKQWNGDGGELHEVTFGG